MVLGFLCAAATACGGNSESPSTLPPVDTQTEEPPATASEAPEEDTSDTGPAVERPPELPELCELTTAREGEKLAGAGAGSMPDIQYNPGVSSALVAWAYFDDPNGGDRWEIQAARYAVAEVAVDGGLALERTVGTVRNPVAPSIVSEDPALAAGSDGFGLVWRDGRWDADCDLDSFPECRREVAFMALDENGDPLANGAEPARLTTGADLKHRPSIGPVPEGYLVTWTESHDNQFVLMSARVDNAGTLLATAQLSDEGALDEFGGSAVAANDQLAVIVWAPEDRNSVVVRVWPHDEPAPSEEIMVVSDDGDELLQPRIAAGDEGFMVLWSARVDSDLDLFLRPLDDQGEPVLEPERATWTPTDIFWADVAWGESSYAIAWASKIANGENDCVREECNSQIFAALLGGDGAPTSAPVMLSDDPNESRRVELAWDKEGWTAVWEKRGLNRWQMMYGEMICQ